MGFPAEHDGRPTVITLGVSRSLVVAVSLSLVLSACARPSTPASSTDSSESPPFFTCSDVGKLAGVLVNIGTDVASVLEALPFLPLAALPLQILLDNAPAPCPEAASAK